MRRLLVGLVVAGLVVGGWLGYRATESSPNCYRVPADHWFTKAHVVCR